jgi:hypothetical protein
MLSDRPQAKTCKKTAMRRIVSTIIRTWPPSPDKRDYRNVARTALVYTMHAMGEKIRSTGSEHSLQQRIRLISRIFIALNWLVILSISFLHRVPRSVALGAFTVFRVTAVCASLWLLFEIAGTRSGHTTIKNLLIDAVLVLPMYGFWLLVAAAAF